MTISFKKELGFVVFVFYTEPNEDQGSNFIIR
jgi:hypothetical protein